MLLTIAAMETAGILQNFAGLLNRFLPNEEVIVTALGLVSSIVDNIPVTAATMGMYDLNIYPIDSKLWEMLAYAVGTGGSILLIGSPAGIVAMGMEKINLGWYVRKITFPVIFGYVLGIYSFLMIYKLLN